MSWEILHRRSLTAYEKYGSLPPDQQERAGNILLEQAALNEEQAFFDSMGAAPPLVRGEMAVNMVTFWLLQGQRDKAIEALRIGGNSRDVPQRIRAMLMDMLLVL